MSITTDGLNRFHEFAVSMVSRRQTELTLAELVVCWQQAQERVSANKSVKQSLAELEAGQGQPAREFLAEMKSKYKLTPDLATEHS